MRNWKMVMSIFMAVIFVLAGCQKTPAPVESTRPPADHQSLNRLFVPPGAVVTNATFWIHAYSLNVSAAVNLHRITSDWGEATVTWNSFGGAYAPAVITTFAPTSGNWASANVTTLVQGWISGTYANYGLLIEQPTSDVDQYYRSSEFLTVALRPKLEITYTLNGGTQTFVIQRGTLGDVADAYIWQLSPDNNFGTSADLITRNQAGSNRKQSLVRFNLDVQGGGCTRTPGYWKTHSRYGPAPYDATWALILPSGENTTFFLSGMTYYQVINMSSAGGNAYAILGRAYIAAKLNVLAGASIPAPVLTAWNQATLLFNTYTIGTVSGWRGSQGERQTFINLAGILDNYNNGITGPGHCEE